MGNSLHEIAEELKSKDKKVQLIYAFNGTGKTRLSREFKELIAPNNDEDDFNELADEKILYYNAFTEDLFYWDNDLNHGRELKLKIHPNKFTKWALEEQGQENNVVRNFQHYTSDKLTPKFNEDFSEVYFSFTRGDDSSDDNIKISKGEESNFIWSVFYSLLDSVISVRNIGESSERDTHQFDLLEYVFIDDPVSSLDDNHLIKLAVDLAYLITRSESEIKFIITTHSPLFYNVLFSELNNKVGYILRKREDGLLEIEEKSGDSNTSFSYHLHIKKIIEDAINNNSIQKYHFMLLRNLYEKTASFLGYQKWGDLLPDDKKLYLNRIIQFTSHSSLSNEVIAEPTEPEQNIVKFLLTHLTTSYHFWQQEER